MKTSDAIHYYGSTLRLAQALGIARAAVYQWGEDVPELRQYQLEVLTQGALRAERPERVGEVGASS